MLLFICGDEKIELLENQSHAGNALINKHIDVTYVWHPHTHTHIRKCKWEHLNIKINISPLAFPQAVAELSQKQSRSKEQWVTHSSASAKAVASPCAHRSCVWHPAGCISEPPETKPHKAWHGSGVSALQLFLDLVLSRHSQLTGLLFGS